MILFRFYFYPKLLITEHIFDKGLTSLPQNIHSDYDCKLTLTHDTINEIQNSLMFNQCLKKEQKILLLFALVSPDHLFEFCMKSCQNY